MGIWTAPGGAVITTSFTQGNATLTDLITMLEAAINQTDPGTDLQAFQRLSQKRYWIEHQEWFYGTGYGNMKQVGGFTDTEMVKVIYKDWLDYWMTGDVKLTPDELTDIYHGRMDNPYTDFDFQGGGNAIDDTINYIDNLMVDRENWFYNVGGWEWFVGQQTVAWSGAPTGENREYYLYYREQWDYWMAHGEREGWLTGYTDAVDNLYDITLGNAGQTANDAYDATIGGMGQSLNDFFGGGMEWIEEYGIWVVAGIAGLVLLWIFYKK